MNSSPALGIVKASPGRGLGFTDTSVHPTLPTLIVSPTFAGFVPFMLNIELDVDVLFEGILVDEESPELELPFKFAPTVTPRTKVKGKNDC